MKQKTAVVTFYDNLKSSPAYIPHPENGHQSSIISNTVNTEIVAAGVQVLIVITNIIEAVTILFFRCSPRLLFERAPTIQCL